MTPERATIIGVVIGGAITLCVTVIGNILNIVVQWFQNRWQLKRDIIIEFKKKQIVALQNCIFLIDVLSASAPPEVFKSTSSLAETWKRVRRENECNSIYLPPELQNEFSTLNQSVILRDDIMEAASNIDYARLNDFRSKCLFFINNEYNKQTHFALGIR